MRFFIIFALLCGLSFSSFAGDSLNILVSKCVNLDSDACTKVGELYLNGYQDDKFTEIKPNYDLALLYSRKGCSLKNAKACFYLGDIFEKGLGQPVSLKDSFKYYDYACDLDDVSACARIGKNIFEEKYELSTTGKDSSLKYLDKACSFDDAYSCYLEGMLYLEEENLKNYDKAHKHFELGCTLGEDSSCFELGKTFLNGLGTKKDYDRANALFKQVCANESQGGKACYYL